MYAGYSQALLSQNMFKVIVFQRNITIFMIRWNSAVCLKLQYYVAYLY